MRRRILVAAAAVLAVVAAGCGGDGTTDSAAGAGTGERQPMKIVPLNGDIAEIVFALGLGDEVVGVDTSATYPAEAGSKPKIGYQRTLNAEGIIGLQPTIAVGTAEAGPPEVLDQIRKAGIKVEIIDTPKTVDDIPTRIRAVADTLGVTAKGTELADRAVAEIKAAKESVPSNKPALRVAFLYVRGPTTAMLGGVGTRADAMITAAGATDAGTEAGVRGFKPITPEALVTAKPDVILFLDAGLQSIGGVDGALKLPGVAQTPAGAARRIISLDDQYLLGMGPRGGNALKDLVAKLYQPT